MTKKPPSQKVLVLKHLLRYGSITDAVAREKYGITRLAARIEDLRCREPFAFIAVEMVQFKTRLGRRGRYAKYTPVPWGLDGLKAWAKKQTEAK